jgi:NitT/TauT family transport system ATP-binding protein
MVTLTAAAPALVLRDVSHWYPVRHGALRALDGVDIAVAEGEFVSLVGPSGCGKSTLLRAAAGLLAPTAGASTVLGQAPPAAAAAHQLGLVTQDPGLLPWRTVAANVALSLEIAGIEGRGATVDALLDAVALRPFADYYPRQLSGGMRQRVALARALAHRPRLLLMDEPFGALDAQTRNDMQSLLLNIWEETAATVLFVTHDVAEAVFLADRIYVVSSRPGTILDEVPIPFPRPRSQDLKESREFHDLEAHALALLRRAGGAGQVRVTV